MTSRIVVIGVGNPDRGDDAAGHAVAKRLESAGLAGVEILRLPGEAARLLEACENAKAVFMIDACISGAAAGTVQRLDARESLPAETAFGFSSHGFGLAEAIALGKTLDALPPVCIVYAIEGARFELGEPLSRAVFQGVEDVVSRILLELDALQRGA